MFLSRSLLRITPLLFAAVLACNQSKPSAEDANTPTAPLAPDQVLNTDATVRHINLEGGCWVLETATGERYQPTELADDFRVEGMTVSVTLRDAPDMMSMCMVAPLVEVVDIKKR
jgi:hypothetical protein